MSYLNCTLGFLSAALIMGAASAVIAQENNSAQMPQQMQQGQPMQPAPAVPPGAYRAWPGTPALATGQEAGDRINSEGGDAIPALPLEMQTAGGINYITGGIGDEELVQIKAAEHGYNMHMLFSAPGGVFISDVDLRISDAGGKELMAVTGAGPYFYARLAPGSYNIELNGEGDVKKIPLKIGDNTNIKKVIEFKETGGVITPHQPTATVE